MRLVGVLATCFVLLAALIYGFQHRAEIGLQLADRVKEMIPAETAAVDAHALPAAATPAELIMPMREAGRLNAFSGFPGYTKATFALPRSSAAQSGVLLLDLNGELEQGAQGILRVTVNGVRRAELVLDEGRLRRRLAVPLNIRDLAGQTVTVALSAEGQAPQAECTADWNGGIVAQILPSSHLKLVIDAPLSDPADLLLAQAAPRLLEWPEAGPMRAGLLRAAHLNATQGEDILLASADSGALAMDAGLMDALEARAVARATTERDVLDLAAALGRKRSVAFEGEAGWRVTFDRRRFAQGAPAAALDLQMRYDAAGDDSGWLLSVRLNDRLVHSEALDGASGQIARRLELPTADQPMLNDLRVTLTSAEQRAGRCIAGRPASADILQARLTLAAPEADSPWAALQTVLQDQMQLAVHPQLGPTGAQLALDLLGGLQGATPLQLTTAQEAAAEQPRITAVPLAALDAALAPVDPVHSWLVLPDPEDSDMLRILRVGDRDAQFHATAARAVLLIEERPHFASAGMRP
ncbi:hypothetical protein [Pseudoponticoccus marisrubri]|uniref:Cyclic di-GMP-binding protein n=1 Tax=Pseudoponticoccus marisrubri TaxID=1685382 RepID=A0A0W7WML6_9RHOB|nr:hypothetical protein [Pseudoponticoccus marisrubri]KUF11829.1 hypothetical protein AVJ23_04405 [Pseudoponticoccus marisrubri]